MPATGLEKRSRTAQSSLTQVYDDFPYVEAQSKVSAAVRIARKCPPCCKYKTFMNSINNVLQRIESTAALL